MDKVAIYEAAWNDGGFSKTVRALTRKGIRKQDAEDAAASAWAKAWERLDEWSGAGAIQAWIFMISLNGYIQDLRKHKREAPLNPDLVSSILSKDRRVDDVLATKQLAEIAYAALDRVDPRIAASYRTAVDVWMEAGKGRYDDDNLKSTWRNVVFPQTGIPWATFRCHKKRAMKVMARAAAAGM